MKCARPGYQEQSRAPLFEVIQNSLHSKRDQKLIAIITKNRTRLN